MSVLRVIAVLMASLVFPACGPGCSSDPRPTDGGMVDGGTVDGGQAQKVEILRDTWGVPHIYGDTAEAVMYGFGWAQAEDHLRLMSDLYLEANGVLAETFDADDPVTPEVETRDDLVRSDRTSRLFRVAADVTENWELADAEDDPSWRFSTRSLLAAFARGVNAWADEHRASLPAWVPSYTPQGLLALAHYRPLANQVALLLGKAQAAGLPPGVGFLDRGTGEWSGSNQFVVGPSRTANGSVVLLAAPHLPFYGHFSWYEAHLVGGGLDLAGATFYGNLEFAMVHNRTAAFSMTDNGADNADLFTVTIVDDDPTRYRVGDAKVPFEVEDESVALAGGGMQTYRRAYVRLGGFLCPVIDPVDAVDFAGRTTVTAACATAVGDVYTFTQLLKMNLAGGLDAFRAAVAGVHLDKWNLVFGDADGHIFYQCNSRHPRRRAGVDWMRPVDASSVANHWQGLLLAGELPQAQDPAAGFFQNCNNPPSLVTPTAGDPIDMDAFPPDLCWHGNRLAVRGQRLTALLDASHEHTLAELETIASDDYLLSAEWWVPVLVQAAADYGSDPAVDDPDAVARAVTILSGWDFRAEVTATAALLYTLWASQVMGAVSVVAPPGDLGKDALVAGLNALGKTATQLEAKFGTAAVPYGDVHRIRRGTVDVPAGGSEGALQALFLNTSKDVEGKKAYAWGGSSYTMLTEIRAEGVTAVSARPWGESDDPASPHYADMTTLYATGGHKPFWFERADVEANLELRTELAFVP